MPAFLVLVIFFTVILQSSTVFSAHTVCPNQPVVTVYSENADVIPGICNSSEKALSVLKNYGLLPERQIVIDIIEEEIDHRGYMAYGKYDSRTDRIELMSYDSILKKHKDPMMYNEFFDLTHYGGAIAHEIAHAVFHQHSLNISPGPAPQEYLAHAVQLAVLPEKRRDAIIAKANVVAWESGDAISDVYMALEPTGFAVKSYKHLTTTANPLEFIDILLNSKWFYVYIP
jgi:hypothetical protein